jgi:hypothetical protein
MATACSPGSSSSGIWWPVGNVQPAASPRRKARCCAPGARPADTPPSLAAPPASTVPLGACSGRWTARAASFARRALSPRRWSTASPVQRASTQRRWDRVRGFFFFVRVVLFSLFCCVCFFPLVMCCEGS